MFYQVPKLVLPPGRAPRAAEAGKDRAYGLFSTCAVNTVTLILWLFEVKSFHIYIYIYEATPMAAPPQPPEARTHEMVWLQPLQSYIKPIPSTARLAAWPGSSIMPGPLKLLSDVIYHVVNMMFV